MLSYFFRKIELGLVGPPARPIWLFMHPHRSVLRPPKRQERVAVDLIKVTRPCTH